MTAEKTALVLSGGSRLCAYQVGAIKRLYELGVKPRVFAGVSAGGINCAHLAQYDHQFNALQAVDELQQRWMATDTKNVWRPHFPFGLMQAPWKQSVYSTKPMRDLIKRWFDPEQVKTAGNELYMGVVSLQTGRYHIFDIDCPDPREALAASAAMPLFFEPRPLETTGAGTPELCADGGVTTATPLRAAFKAGATQIFVVLTEAEEMAPATELDTVVDIGPRFLAMLAHNVFVLDLGWALAENRLAEQGIGSKRHVEITVIRPSEPLAGDPLQFAPKVSLDLIDRGYRDALRQVS